ncbi:MAG: serine/threonine-protein kinase [Planctomycetota bacterium]
MEPESGPIDPILNSRNLDFGKAPPPAQPDASRVLETCGAPAAPPAAGAAAFIGRVLRGCRIEEFAGAGGFSMVFRATRLATGETVALKLPRVEGFIAHLKREALISSRFQDPQVVPIFEVCLDHDPPFLVMPFVPGKNFVLPDRAPSPWEIMDAFRRFRAIVEVVARLHAAEIAHGDLKPGNIRFAPRVPEPGRSAFHGVASRWADDENWPQLDEVCHLLDLGIARHQLAVRQLSTLRASVISVTGEKIAGTLAFMSPETMSGAPPSKASDVYALGVILHHMLCGRPPAFGVSPDELNEYLPPGSDVFLRDMLQHDPARRIPDAGALLHAIDAFILEERRCLRRRSGHERRLVFTERKRTFLRGVRVLFYTAIVALALTGAVLLVTSPEPSNLEVGREALPLAVALAIPFAVPLALIGTLLGITTINAWISGVPERTYKNRRGHPLWTFMMQ